MRKFTLIALSVAILAVVVYWFFNGSSCSDFIARKYFKTSESAKGRPDKPDIATYRNYVQTVDPQERRVPVERLFEVQKQIRANQVHKAEPMLWEQIPTSMGGRTRTLAWDVNDYEQNKVWAGSVTGGLWYNENIHDGNSVWIPVADFWPTLAVSSIAFDPNNSQVMYVGTGEAETAVITYRDSGGRGAGVMKSSDGGVTWNQLEATSDFYYITDLVVRNEDELTVIYAGVTSGIYMGEEHNAPANGLFRSDDGGETWEQVLPETDGSGVSPVSDIEVAANGRMYVGTMNNLNGDKGSELFYSDNGTVGSWTRYTEMVDVILNDPNYNLKGRVKISSSLSNPNTVYAVFAAGSAASTSMSFPTWHGRYIMKTIDGGLNWVEVNIPNGGGNQWAYLAWHALTIQVDPNNPDVIWAGGLDMNRSDDGGQTWSTKSNWADMYYGGGDKYVHADQHAVAYMPGSSDVAVFASDGGVFYTSNASAENVVFDDHNKNYNTLQFYSGKISPFAGDVAVIGGLQDNGSLLFNGDPLSPAVMVSGGDGGFCYFDPNIQGAYISSVYENQYRVFKNSESTFYINEYSSGTFISPFAVNFNEKRLYANAMTFDGDNVDKLLVITDFYDYSFNGQQIDAGTGSTVPYSYIYASPYSTTHDVLYIGTSAGNLFKLNIDDVVNEVNDITGDNFPNGYISSINMADNEDTLIVTFSNYGVQSLWLTVNGGTTWQDVEGNLPDIPVRFAIFHPNNSRQMMLATESGVWQTSDVFAENVEWVINDGLPYVRTDMLDVRIVDNVVLAASHGRGLFTSVWEVESLNTSEKTPIQPLTVYPNPVKSGKQFSVQHSVSGAYEIIISTIDGRIVFRQTNRAQSNGIISFAAPTPGNYIVAMVSGGKKYQSNIVVY